MNPGREVRWYFPTFSETHSDFPHIHFTSFVLSLPFRMYSFRRLLQSMSLVR